MTVRRIALDDGSLIDLLNRLVDTGAVVSGDVLLTLAGVDLIRLDLRLLLSSVQTLEPADTGAGRPVAAGADPVVTDPVDATSARAMAETPGPGHPPGPRPAARLDGDARPGLAGLLVAVVDIVRQLLEHQAIRRMEAGALGVGEVERLGHTLMALEHQTTVLAEALAPNVPPHQEVDI